MAIGMDAWTKTTRSGAIPGRPEIARLHWNGDASEICSEGLPTGVIQSPAAMTESQVSNSEAMCPSPISLLDTWTTPLGWETLRTGAA